MKIRKTFVMYLKPGCEFEYKKRHDELWVEMIDTLKSHGVHNYSISLEEEANQLFGYVEIDSEDMWNDIANTEICKKWWAHMKDIMLTNPDNSPKSKELTEVFYME